jgi:hypothetical protein
MNYTKGKWAIHNQDFRSGNELEIHPEVGIDGIYPFYCKVGGREKVANAHLIAAAPDMYEALQEAKRQLEYLADKFTPTGTGVTVLSRINIALAKAEGKTTGQP